MCAVFVGDVQWLSAAYCGEEMSGPFKLEYLSGKERDFGDRVSSSAVVVMLTDQISHAVRRQVISAASANGVPVYMRHSCGASCMDACLRVADLNR